MTRLFFIFGFVFLFCVAAQAQTPPIAAEAAAPASAAAPAVDPAVAAEEERKRLLNMPFNGSFLFSPLEIAAILQANAGKPPGGGILNADKAQYIPPRRVISLAGVLFRNQDDWIVWLNGSKVMPKNLLPEIVDISVANDVVRLKWYDIGMNKIIDISLRPHQTYDIVTGILLPG